MPDMLETLKYTFTVDGETEQWYLLWLRDQINACPDRDKNISIVPKVQQSPAKFYKSTSRKVTPVVTHICDVESNEPVHVSKFQTILSEMKDAQTNKRIDYHLGYSNFSFELWMVLHRALLEEEAATVEETKAKVEAEEKNHKATEAQVEQLMTWAEKYDASSYEAKHLIIAALVDRVEINKNHDIKIFFKMSAEQLLGKVVRIA